MNSAWNDPAAPYFETFKLLRFGTEQPKCERCGITEIRALCRVPRAGKPSAAILCHNCKGKREKVNGKASVRQAKRFTDAGYFKPECVICTEPTLQILECDHLAHEANSTLCEPLCGNHHAIKSSMFEHGPLAALRLRDPQRRALVLQAALEFGLAAILAMFAVWEGADEETARCIFFGLSSAALFAWATWNLAADEYFVGVLGPAYDRAIPAPVPR
jgi:hypothetical protein